MTRTHRLGALALLATLAMGTAACGISGGPEAIEDPRPSTTTTTTAPTDPSADDGIVWQEITGGGFVPTEFALGEVPDVTIYADGRILVTALDADGNAARPAAFEEARIPDDDLAAFLADATSSGLFEPGTDFGQPGVTDMPSTTVTLRDGGAPETIDVYALDFVFDGPVGDVNAAQAARRAQLKELVARARGLADRTEPYIPERIRATLVTSDVPVDAGAAPQEWPGPPLSSFPAPPADGSELSCLVIEGPDAATVSAAAADHPASSWNLDGQVHLIVTAPLVPGEEGCPPR